MCDLRVRANREFYTADKQKELAEKVNKHIVILCIVVSETIGSSMIKRAESGKMNLTKTRPPTEGIDMQMRASSAD